MPLNQQKKKEVRVLIEAIVPDYQEEITLQHKLGSVMQQFPRDIS